MKDLLGEHVCPVLEVVYPCWPSPHNVLVFQAEDVRRVADSELGFQQVTLSRPTQAKTYLFINTERMVVGCLVAEPIRQVGLEMCVCVCGRFFFFTAVTNLLQQAMSTCDPASHWCHVISL